MPTWKTIFLTQAGSQAHGTAGDDSDLDVRGVCILPLRQRLSLFQNFEQYEGEPPKELEVALKSFLASKSRKTSSFPKIECVIFELEKFLRLCASANPNTLEILCAHPDDWVHHTTLWEKVWSKRHLFLTRKIQQTFLGYGLSQLKKIRSHRAWLLNPPTQKPVRQDFDFQSTAASTKSTAAETEYKKARQRWDSYQQWKKQRNPIRA